MLKIYKDLIYKEISHNKYYRSFFIQHFDKVIEVFSVPFIVEPFLKIPLKSAMQVAFHFIAESWLCNWDFKILVILVPILKLLNVFNGCQNVFHNVLLLFFIILVFARWKVIILGLYWHNQKIKILWLHFSKVIVPILHIFVQYFFKLVEIFLL